MHLHNFLFVPLCNITIITSLVCIISSAISQTQYLQMYTWVLLILTSWNDLYLLEVCKLPVHKRNVTFGGFCPGFLQPTAQPNGEESGKKRAQETRDTSHLLDSVQAEVERLQWENEDLLASLERDRRTSRSRAVIRAAETDTGGPAGGTSGISRVELCFGRCTQLEEQLTRVL